MSYQEMDTVFNHFGMGGPSETIEQLWRKGYVLVHYEDQASFDKSKYDDKPSDLETLNTVITDNDAYLCLTRIANKHSGTDVRRLGVIPEDAERLVVGIRDSDHEAEVIHDLAEAERREDEFKHVYKGTKLRDSDHKTLNGADYFLSAYEPPFTSFSKWPVVERQLQATMAGESLPPKEEHSYATAQLELLCEEYLRLVDPTYCPLMETGGPTGTHQVDLLGEADGRIVYGEVKNTKSSPDDAVENLGVIVREHTPEMDPEVDAYLFTRKPPEKSDDAVTVVRLRSVLDTLWEHDRTQRVMGRMTAQDLSG